MRWVMFIMVPLLLFAVNEGQKKEYFKVLQERHNPYIFDKKERFELEKERIRAQTQKDIAHIEYKKSVDVAKIKKDTVAIKSQKGVEKERVAIEASLKRTKLLEKIAFYLFIFGVLFLLFIYLLFKRWQAHKERLEIERLKQEREAHEKELALREKELQVQAVGKMVELLSSGKLSKDQESKIIALLENGKRLNSSQSEG